MKIALLGYGKMGKAIEQVVNTEFSEQHQIVVRVHSQNVDLLADQQLEQADVAIEFSTPHAAFDNICRALTLNIPVVSGTTAWLDHPKKGLEKVKQICDNEQKAFFYASNFSIGANIFFSLNAHLARLMGQFPEYAVQIDEIHHKQKLDAPSGTAISLAKAIIAQHPQKQTWVNHLTKQADELSIISHRKERVKGTHEITYHSEIDTLSIKHTAHSRVGFAKGAILAAQWLIGKKGVFGMKDMLEL